MLIYNEGGIIRRRPVNSKGSGVLNTLINKLPIELHIPGYRFCGPGTHLQKRLQRGDRGINLLDEACKDHDIAYAQSRELSKRHEADQILAERAWKRFRSKDATVGEKLSALTIAGVMKGKTKFGMGTRRKSGRRRGRGVRRITRRRRGRGVRSRLKRGGTIGFQRAVARARNRIRGTKDVMKAAKLALSALGGSKVRAPKGRVLRIPKRGGVLPLIPIFSALGALGSLGGGSAAVIKAIAEARNAKNELKEKERHNRAMETISVGKGLRLGPYKGGYGIYFKPSKNYR